MPLDDAGCHDAVEFWQPDIHEHNIGSEAFHLCDGFEAIERLPNDADARETVKILTHSLPYLPMLVRD